MATLHDSGTEVLRYLGYHGQEITPELEKRIDYEIARCNEVSRPASVTAAYAVRDAGERLVTLEGCAVRLEGRDIACHLHDAGEVVLVAATLGTGIDRELRRLSLTDPLGQVVFDAAASACIERVVDEIEATIRADAAERGLYCSWRFSPGYGDLPLDVQPQLLAALNATRRLGITLTPSNLMVPTKSVTAVVGLHVTPQPGLASSCSVCTLAEFCSLRTRGITCRDAKGTVSFVSSSKIECGEPRRKELP